MRQKHDPADAPALALGRRMRDRRIYRRLSQTDLAQACGVTFQQIQKYESGETRMPVAVLIAIAEALNVPPAELLPRPKNKTIADLLELNAEELALLNIWRSLNDKNFRRATLKFLQSIKEINDRDRQR